MSTTRVVKYCGRYFDLDRIVSISEIHAVTAGGGWNNWCPSVCVYVQLLDKPIMVYLGPPAYAGNSIQTYSEPDNAIKAVTLLEHNQYLVFLEAWKEWTSDRPFEAEVL